ncbi:MAG: hydroxyacylglutathione hydrolase [Pseudomonadota bacterium]|nr:hydroxyacylglutathione hydrolase [Pseudomonadota bacterium]
MSCEIHLFPCLTDNYGFLIHDRSTGLTASVDTPEVSAINVALSQKSWNLTHIFNTHHHQDHAGGNLELKEKWKCKIVGAANDEKRIPGIDEKVVDGDRFKFGGTEVKVFEIPGHTKGHIAYYFASEHVVFVGDTIFSMGCGRLFEGTASQMWSSLQKLMALPLDTKIYCAHEYTESNADFAITIDPSNSILKNRVAEVRELRRQSQPTIPTTLKLEKATNPFLRAENDPIKANLNMIGREPENVFAKIRKLKDSF